jgi:hypothetical protein
VSDAVPAKARKATTSLSFVTCLIATLSIMGAVYFDKIEGAQPWTVKFGAAETTSLTLSFNAGLNLVFFMLKVILQVRPRARSAERERGRAPHRFAPLRQPDILGRKVAP